MEGGGVSAVRPAPGPAVFRPQLNVMVPTWRQGISSASAECVRGFADRNFFVLVELPSSQWILSEHRSPYQSREF